VEERFRNDVDDLKRLSGRCWGDGEYTGRMPAGGAIRA
jgi:hypothetical protein